MTQGQKELAHVKKIGKYKTQNAGSSNDNANVLRRGRSVVNICMNDSYEWKGKKVMVLQVKIWNQLFRRIHFGTPRGIFDEVHVKRLRSLDHSMAAVGIFDPWSSGRFELSPSHLPWSRVRGGNPSDEKSPSRQPCLREVDHRYNINDDGWTLIHTNKAG